MNHIKYIDLLLEAQPKLYQAVVKNIPLGTRSTFTDENGDQHSYQFSFDQQKLIGKTINVYASDKYIPMWYTYVDDGMMRVFFHKNWLSFEEGVQILLFPQD